MTVTPFDLTTVTDPDAAASVMPGGWRPRVYRLGAGRLHLARRRLELLPGLSVEEISLLAGSIRIDGAFDPGHLKIGFLDTDGTRILGNRVTNVVMAVAYGGARFDSAAWVPSMALTLNFSPAMARHVVPDEVRPRLLQRLRGPDGLAAMLFPVTPQAAALLSHLRRLLTLAQSGATLLDPVFSPDAVVAASAELIDQILAVELLVPGMSVGRRREVALAVEAFLWETPTVDGFRKFSIDDAAERLGASRRSIQLALREEFGMGFVAFKRAIRLQQVHSILRAEPRAGIGEIARAHEFYHQSRFSRLYREMFGVLPSSELDGGAAGD